MQRSFKKQTMTYFAFILVFLCSTSLMANVRLATNKTVQNLYKDALRNAYYPSFNTKKKLGLVLHSLRFEKLIERQLKSVNALNSRVPVLCVSFKKIILEKVYAGVDLNAYVPVEFFDLLGTYSDALVVITLRHDRFGYYQIKNTTVYSLFR